MPSKDKNKILEQKRRSYHKNKDKHKEKLAEKRKKNWGRHIKERYGIDEETYLAMFDMQKGLCYICQKPSAYRLCVDHNHVTGTVRKLLCRRCNSILGQVDENPSLLAGMISYLREHI